MGNAPMCTSGCSKLVWNFEAGSVDGIAPINPVGQQVVVRPFMGSNALALDVTNLEMKQIEFTVPVCLSGTTSIQTRTLTARFFFEGGASAGNQYYVQASAPTPVNGNFLTTQDAASGTYLSYSAPLNMSASSSSAGMITFRVGSFGAAFSGTVWFDDITIQ
jgi:hypothetical protein